MTIDSSYFAIWAIFTFLETFGIVYIKNPELKSIRPFLVFCVLRDTILLLAAHSVQTYWDIGWTCKEIELVWLAWIAGSIIQPGRAWRLPAFAIAAMCFDAFWRNGWPYWSESPLTLTADLHQIQRTSCVIILGTLVIGAALILQKKQLPLVAAVAILTACDMLSAQSYLSGYFAPKVASVVWVGGLGILVAVSKAHPQSLELQPAGFERRESEPLDTRSDLCIRLPLTPKPRFWS